MAKTPDTGREVETGQESRERLQFEKSQPVFITVESDATWSITSGLSRLWQRKDITTINGNNYYLFSIPGTPNAGTYVIKKDKIPTAPGKHKVVLSKIVTESSSKTTVFNAEAVRGERNGGRGASEPERGSTDAVPVEEVLSIAEGSQLDVKLDTAGLIQDARVTGVIPPLPRHPPAAPVLADEHVRARVGRALGFLPGERDKALGRVTLEAIPGADDGATQAFDAEAIAPAEGSLNQGEGAGRPLDNSGTALLCIFPSEVPPGEEAQPPRMTESGTIIGRPVVDEAIRVKADADAVVASPPRSEPEGARPRPHPAHADRTALVDLDTIRTDGGPRAPAEVPESDTGFLSAKALGLAARQRSAEVRPDPRVDRGEESVILDRAALGLPLDSAVVTWIKMNRKVLAAVLGAVLLLATGVVIGKACSSDQPKAAPTSPLEPEESTLPPR